MLWDRLLRQIVFTLSHLHDSRNIGTFPDTRLFLVVKGVLLEATAWAVTILGEMGPHQELSVELGDQL